MSRTAARSLLEWYDRQRRDLPWRRASSAYRTLVSEFMLQQTVVATVVPFFLRFVARFPDFAALAAASEEEVLACWSGLGYYARARNLHRTARVVVERYGGVLPADEAALRKLPGVGEYTAAAVAAIAFGVRTFPLDGNAARVMARFLGILRPIDDRAVRAELRAAGQLLVPAERAGDFAQAVMELGARVCVTGTAPRCADCPLKRTCQACARGNPGTLPVRRPRAPKQIVVLACVAALRRGRVLMVRRPVGSLLGGTWTLPAAERAPRETDMIAARRALADFGFRPSGVRSIGSIRHLFTHRDVTARVFRARALGVPRTDAEMRWVAHTDLATLALSSFTRKTLTLAGIQGKRWGSQLAPGEPSA